MKDVKIFLVGDDAFEVKDIKKILESFDYSISYMVGEGELINKASEIMPDLILMDLITPDKQDIINTVFKLKKLNIPVIFLVDNSDVTAIEKTRLIEPYVYLTKPFDAVGIKHAIELAIYKNNMEHSLAKSEKARMKSEETFSSLFETMTLGLVYQDSTGKVISANPAAEKILGLTIDEMNGRTSADPRWKSIHEDGSKFHGEDHPSMVALKTGKKVKNVIMGIFNPEKNENNWIKIDAIPQFKEGERRPYQVYTTFEDITSRKKAEDNQKTLSEQLQLALDAAKMGWWHYDPLNDISTYDDKYKEIFGVSGSECPNQEILKLLHPDDIQGVWEKVTKALDPARPQPYSAEYRIYRDQNIRWIEAHGTATFEGEGDQKHATSLVGTVVDVTERKKIQENLIESRNKLNTVIESMNDAVFVSDVDGNFIDFNEAFATYHKFKSKEEVYRTLSEFTDYIDVYFEDGTLAPLDMWAVPRALRGEKVFDERYILQRKDTGEKWWGSYSFGPIKDENGEITGSVVVGRDITEIKKNEEKYQNALDNMMEGCQIISPDWRYIYLNEAAAKHAKLEKEDLMGHTMMEVYPDIVDTEMFSMLKGAMKERKSDQMENYFIYPDGTSRWFELRVFPVPEGIFILSIDITDRKKAEKKFIESNKFNENIIDSMGDGFSILDVNGVHLNVNRALSQMTGFSREELIGTGLPHPYWPREETHNIQANLEKVLKGKLKEVELIFKRKNGERFPVILSPSILTDDEGKISAVFGTFKDISERKKLEMDLKESEQKFKMVADFTYDWEYWISPDKSLLYVSPSCERISGYKPEEFQDDPELLVKITHPDDKKIILEHENELFTAKVNRYIEFRIIRKNGEEIWISHNCQPIFTENGEFLGRRASNKDINDRKNAENALSESEHKFRELVENAADALFVHDFDGNIMDVNRQAIESLGYTREELLQMNVMDIELDFNLESAQKEWSKIESEKPLTLYGHQKRKNGTDFPVEIRFAGVEINDKKLIMGLVRDITSIKKAEKELRESEEKYRYVVETASEGITLFDKRGTVIGTNPKALELTGFDDVIDKNVTQIASKLKINSNEALTAFKNVLSGKSIPPEWEYVNRKGETKFVKANYSPMKKDGKIEGIVLVLEDITDLKLREKALRENEQFLENIIENIPDVIFVKTADELKFERVNKAAERIWGFNRDELIGKTDYDFFTRDEADFYTKKDREVLNRKELQDILEETIHTKNQGERILHTKKIPLLDEKGHPNYLLGISEDITQRKMAERKIEKSLEEKDDLLREIHHRVNNNMQIISSMLNLQRSYVKEEESKDILKDSQSRVKSMAMIHEKLYISHDLSHINFKEYAEKLVSEIFYTYGVQIGTIERILNIEDVELNMETAIPLGLIINELVTNSLKFAFPHETGSITIELEVNDNHTLTVADDGIGLPQDFDLKKVDSLGLDLVNSLVNQLDGNITIDRSHGTKYHINFRELDYSKRF
ncbi:MAG: PAS domain S-box protein [Methanobacterium formicicum]